MIKEEEGDEMDVVRGIFSRWQRKRREIFERGGGWRVTGGGGGSGSGSAGTTTRRRTRTTGMV